MFSVHANATQPSPTGLWFKISPLFLTNLPACIAWATWEKRRHVFIRTCRASRPVPVWLAVTPPQRHWEGSASRSKQERRSDCGDIYWLGALPAGATIQQQHPSPPPSPSPSLLDCQTVVSTLQPGCTITSYTILAKVGVGSCSQRRVQTFNRPMHHEVISRDSGRFIGLQIKFTGFVKDLKNAEFI